MGKEILKLPCSPTAFLSFHGAMYTRIYTEEAAKGSSRKLWNSMTRTLFNKINPLNSSH